MATTDRFTRERTFRYARIILVAVMVGAAVGLVTGTVLGLGIQYLGSLEGYRLGSLTGSFIGAVFGGTSGRGVRGLLAGGIGGALVGAGIGNAAWNAQLADQESLVREYGKWGDAIVFPSLPLLKIVVMGSLIGATVGGIAGAIPA